MSDLAFGFMLPPLLFAPIPMERVWGGRSLARYYEKPLPPNVSVGESWEITDRPDAMSVVREGPFTGQSLRWLMEQHAGELLGDLAPHRGRFPWLVKLLDARETLSIQVHPPARLAAELGGEPKTEMWYVAVAEPGAKLYAGVRPGITRRHFEEAIRAGQAANCVNAFSVQAGDFLFLPSGRVHALGGGLMVFEIQQNSDTTYRVFDWNRLGSDGKPRALHIAESLACIDFEDHVVSILHAPVESGSTGSRVLLRDVLFRADLVDLAAESVHEPAPGVMTLVGVIEGQLCVRHDQGDVVARPGDFVLLPARRSEVKCVASVRSRLLCVEPGAGQSGKGA